ncbi:isochorismatase family protein [Uliginosibacterium sp. 31-16]|uniref:cysteine hydrolase family protein n=1 Tax=Uliginosibacterium sp. 31-16 TaxID=3068315 RepID=UPI00273E9385|nr:isochorismatase family protein [Uliginosibacterium sp. 31-16]MDP5240309.1 isochorismatase family protein [Uliginosibacterium sp. 31-16]
MKSALIFIDVQESFRQRPFWSEAELPRFVERASALLDGCAAQGIPLVRILHAPFDAPADSPFSPTSPHVRCMKEFAQWLPAIELHKSRHSSLVGTNLVSWLHQQEISRLMIAGIRTEQCCETTARHASDEGFRVDFITEATLTFAMQHPLSNETLSPADIYRHTETVLAGRFATITTVTQALQRAQESLFA